MIGYNNNPDIEDEGWYNFTISNTTSVSKGEVLLLNMTETGISRTSIDIYFNTTQYDSRINLPTDTYVHVDSVQTYNASGSTNLFTPGENATLRTQISDPFGYEDIRGAKLDIQYPNGSYLLKNYSINRVFHTRAYGVYEYNFTVPDTPGKYIVRVTGVETNGVTDTREYEFFVKASEGVVIYPDTTLIAEPGTHANFNLSIMNIGNLPDTYIITASPPSERFPFTLYINGSKAAIDSDGDGVWNWINSSWESNGELYISLAPGSSAKINVVKEVPNSTWGESDFTILNATSQSNSSVYGNANITVDVPVQSLSKVLYLTGDSELELALKHGETEETEKISSGNRDVWTFPRVYADVNLTGYLTVNLYMNVRVRGFSTAAVSVTLYADSTEIGKASINVEQSTADWFTFTIYPEISTIPADSSISLQVSDTGYQTSTTVYYNSTEYPSNITIPTSDFINIKSLKFYNSSGFATDNFSANSTVRVVAEIESPFGPDDVSNATLNITDPLGTSMLTSQIMSIASVNGGTKIFEYAYTIPSDGYSGYWKVRVTDHDDPVIWVNKSSKFFVLWDVNVTPDHNASVNVSNSSQTLYFNHTITNTGLGANIFEIKVVSSGGFDVKLYIGGTLVSEDTNGDGSWDYVNPNYDTDGDGIPDTGLLLPGQSENVTLAVTVPANFSGNDTVTITAYSFISQGINDNARDNISTVPELSQIIFVPILVLMLILIKRRRKFTPS